MEAPRLASVAPRLRLLPNLQGGEHSMADAEERFRPWRGFMVGDHGTIIGKSGAVRKPVAHRQGYLTLRDGRSGGFLIHRAVAAAWCAKPPGCDVVNHLNGDKQDNRATNLEWTTQRANVEHWARSGRAHWRKPPGFMAGEKNGAARPVIVEGQRFPYARAAAAALGISPQGLHSRLKSKNFPAYRYADEEPPL